MPTRADLFRMAAALETHRADLLVAGNVEGLTDLLSEDLYYAHSTGLVDDKTSFLQKLKNGGLQFQAADVHLDAVTALGEQGFQVSGLLDLRVQVGGQLRHIQAIYLATWRQEKAVWRLVGFQAARAPEPA
jgi:hypothetical protein